MKNQYLVPGSIILAGIIIAGAVLYSNSPARIISRLNDYVNTPREIEPVEVSVDDDYILGDPDAPITLVAFGDYECPFCERLYFGAEAEIREKYVETGLVRMVYRDFPLNIHASAIPAAEAAQCAGDQDAFWQYHDALYERQSQLPSMNYVALAGELGLNTEDFSSCFTERKYQDEVAFDRQEGVRYGVPSTPTTFVNGQIFIGNLPFEHFEQFIENALANL